MLFKFYTSNTYTETIHSNKGDLKPTAYMVLDNTKELLNTETKELEVSCLLVKKG